MKILVYSHVFHPMVGGIETMSIVLAEEFQNLGHEVRVVTPVPSDASDNFSFSVIRDASTASLCRQINWADTILVNNVSARVVALLIGFHRPFVVRHATWIRSPDGRLRWRDRIKQRLLRFGSGISNSNAMASHIKSPSVVVENCYNDHVFSMGRSAPERDIVFAGRLVSDKGVDILLRAIHLLSHEGISASLTIVGDGPERASLENLSAELGLTDHVQFLGRLLPSALASTFRDHRIAAFPSIWDEPFGIVALEAAACGCFVIGSDGGGLSDAIGPCGVTFRNGDVEALAGTVRDALTKRWEACEACHAHLRAHTRVAVATRYLEVLYANRRKRATGGIG